MDAAPCKREGEAALPIVPGFQYDLFVSYAHYDDPPWRDSPGWVTEFVRDLRDALRAKDRDFTLWSDPTLRTGEDFNVAIGDAIARTAVFLSVLSPAYNNSWYCQKEVAAFREQRHPSFGMLVGSLSRMQGMVAENVPLDKWPPELRSTSPFPFFSETVDRFFKPAVPDEKSPYVQGLWKVRNSIWAVLDEMRRQKAQGTVIEHSYEVKGTPTVCLAEVTDDLYYKRENLRSALGQLKEFQVVCLSDLAVPTGPEVLTVHLVGALPGRPAPGQDLPLSRLQLDAALAANPARRPLVWLGRDLKTDEVEPASHKQFLESLQNHNGIELVRSGFEDLKDEIQKRMRPRSSPVVKTVRRAREDPIVYIWHQIGDAGPLSQLKTRLKESNCGISVFPYSSVPPEKLQSKLAFCDGLVVPYTAETKSSAEEMMTAAFQLRRREERPIAFAAVELPPTAGDAFNFEHPRVVPVHGEPSGNFSGLDQFLGKLEEEDV
jgi:hypothetical protein